MPRGDGTGPAGMGPMTGRAAGYCAGYAVPGFMNPLPGRGFWGGGGLGAGGTCLCPRCGKTVPHQRGQPCTDMICPSCGASMARARWAARR